jgi:hypothetical protein
MLLVGGRQRHFPVPLKLVSVKSKQRRLFSIVLSTYTDQKRLEAIVRPKFTETTRTLLMLEKVNEDRLAIRQPFSVGAGLAKD